VPRLSAIVAVGPQRERGRRCVEAILAQTAGADVEAVVVDLAPEGTTPVVAESGNLTLLRRPGATWGETRTEGVRAAKGDIVAFVEDHTVPEPGWAAALIRAFEGPWDVVGYAFTNANPARFRSEASLIADYGHWRDPARGGPTTFLPSNNVAYRRDVLAGLEEELGTVYTLDVNLHQELLRRGRTLAIEPEARIAHENLERLGDLMQANHDFCRLMSANRVRREHWTTRRRVLYGLAVPLAAPPLKLARLTRSMRGRGLWRTFVRSLPLVAATYAWSAVGESRGYFTARGDEDALLHWEVAAERSSA
jgi:cellulose synthase/poly-beta-1,6-N-acetylglucosamine synthase-like glycosyltransferase